MAKAKRKRRKKGKINWITAQWVVSSVVFVLSSLVIFVNNIAVFLDRMLVNVPFTSNHLLWAGIAGSFFWWILLVANKKFGGLFN